jgi:hypothetical protein
MKPEEKEAPSNAVGAAFCCASRQWVIGTSNLPRAGMQTATEGSYAPANAAPFFMREGDAPRAIARSRQSRQMSASTKLIGGHISPGLCNEEGSTP